MSPTGFVRLLPALGVGLAAGLGVLLWLWLRSSARQRAMSRETLERERRRAQAARWWHQNTLTTIPHSRFFDSAFDDGSGLRGAPTRPPSAG
ncbi:hypothetical protein [Rhizobacter sp. LjRoot28]|uniref:hypothetical protein n=1 Tax=Rhizobacter sp. LjRoot28 TaxID=3342309 RepID=UPI003ECD89E3